MKQKALIWRKEIYFGGFRCNECGKPLADVNGNPYATLPFTPMGNYYACPVCFQPVAVEQTVDVSEDEQGFQGDYKEYLRKRAKLKRRLRK